MIKISWPAVIVAGALLAAGLSIFLVPIHTDPHQRMLNETVEVQFADDEGNKGHGSGVLVSPDLVLTVRHVAKAGILTVVFDDGTTVPATYVLGSTDEIGDYAVVRLAKPTQFPYARISCGPVQLGQALYSVGYPGPWGKTLTKFTVVSLKPKFPDHSRGFMIQGAVVPGISGGPVFDEDGRVVGLNDALLLFAVPLGDLPISIPSASGYGVIVSIANLCENGWRM